MIIYIILLLPLPLRVQTKLQTSKKPPVISEYDAYCKIKSAKKPKSGVPNDLPKAIIQEFSPELSLPVSRIINSMFQSYQWPAHWKEKAYLFDTFFLAKWQRTL